MSDTNDDPMIGAQITDIRAMTDEELAKEGWSDHFGGAPVAIDLDNGTTLYPSKDPEGNGPGALFGDTGDDLIMVTPPRQVEE